MAMTDGDGVVGRVDQGVDGELTWLNDSDG